MDTISRGLRADEAMNARLNKLGGAFLGLLLLIPSPLWAHAFPDHSDPRVGSEISTLPAQAKIWFDAELEPLFSTIEVLDANQKKVDKGDGRVNPGDHTMLEVSLPTLPAGTYQVSWSVVAHDGHRTEGRFSFTIKRGTP